MVDVGYMLLGWESPHVNGWTKSATTVPLSHSIPLQHLTMTLKQSIPPSHHHTYLHPIQPYQPFPPSRSMIPFHHPIPLSHSTSQLHLPIRRFHLPILILPSHSPILSDATILFHAIAPSHPMPCHHSAPPCHSIALPSHFTTIMSHPTIQFHSIPSHHIPSNCPTSSPSRHPIPSRPMYRPVMSRVPRARQVSRWSTRARRSTSVTTSPTRWVVASSLANQECGTTTPTTATATTPATTTAMGGAVVGCFCCGCCSLAGPAVGCPTAASACGRHDRFDGLAYGPSAAGSSGGDPSGDLRCR